MNTLLRTAHSFGDKLRQASVYPRFVAYVEWQRAVRRALSLGMTPPEPPEAWGSISDNLDPTTSCNLACDHCVDWDILNKRIKYEEEILRKSFALKRTRGLKSVILIGGGEPTMYPGFVRMVRYLKELGLHVAIVSNGTENKKILEVADCLDEYDWVRLSLDAGTNDTWVRMHRPKRKDVTLESICSWVPLIKERNPNFAFGFSFIVSWKGAKRLDGGTSVEIIENIHEVHPAIELAKRSRFDYVSLKAVLERNADGSEVVAPEREVECFEEHIQGVLAEAKMHETKTFKVKVSLNLKSLARKAENGHDPKDQPVFCHKGMLQGVLSPRGAEICPALRGQAKALYGGKDAYVDEAAADRTTKNLFHVLNNFDAHVECAQTDCFYNELNWLIEDAIVTGVIPPALEDFGDYYF